MQQLSADWRRADLSPADRALCAFADKLTRRPQESDAGDIDRLRRHGFDDRGIHDAVQVIGYFNYINRVADGLGVEPESCVRAWESSAAAPDRPNS